MLGLLQISLKKPVKDMIFFNFMPEKIGIPLLKKRIV
jgi:hypothetical protein